MSKLKILNSFDLKIIAFISMLIDHFAYFFYFLLNENTYNIFRILGRIAMPIFTFLVYQGFKYSKDINKYIKRILITATITQILLLTIGLIVNYKVPNYQVYIFESANIIFSFALGLLVIILLDRFIKYKTKGLFSILSFIAANISIIFIYFTVKIEYGFIIPIMLLLLYSYDNYISKIKNRILKLLFILIPLILYFVLSNGIFKFTILALPIILLYNGKKGKNIGRLFYYMYPLQYVIFYILGILTFKYKF